MFATCLFMERERDLLATVNSFDDGYVPAMPMFSPHSFFAAVLAQRLSFNFQPHILILVSLSARKTGMANDHQQKKSTTQQHLNTAPWMTSICSQNLPPHRRSSAPGRAPRVPRSSISTPIRRGGRLHRVGPEAAVARWIWPS